MRNIPGKIAEIKLHLGEPRALIHCPADAIPAAGRYVVAADRNAILSLPLFLAERADGGFLAADSVPESWHPGTQLSMHGPLGNGFHVPGDVKHLALVGLGETIARMLPLTSNANAERLNVTVFSDAPLTRLSPDLEAFPLHELPGAQDWADYFAVEVPLGDLDKLAQIFRLSIPGSSTLRGQVLIQTSMPCSGLGKCGVCALKVKRSWKFACEDGPVFDLQDTLKGINS